MLLQKITNLRIVKLTNCQAKLVKWKVEKWQVDKMMSDHALFRGLRQKAISQIGKDLRS